MLIYINRPCTKEELFNLHHASACNVIKRIFGVLKQKFRILHTVPEYSMSIQACIPVALAALHNFNWKYDESEPDCEQDDPRSGGGDGDEAVHNDGVDEPNAMRDQIVGPSIWRSIFVMVFPCMYSSDNWQNIFDTAKQSSKLWQQKKGYTYWNNISLLERHRIWERAMKPKWILWKTCKDDELLLSTTSWTVSTQT